jgi:hypothetical protein
MVQLFAGSCQLRTRHIVSPMPAPHAKLPLPYWAVLPAHENSNKEILNLFCQLTNLINIRETENPAWTTYVMGWESKHLATTKSNTSNLKDHRRRSSVFLFLNYFTMVFSYIYIIGSFLSSWKKFRDIFVFLRDKRGVLQIEC